MRSTLWLATTLLLTLALSPVPAAEPLAMMDCGGDLALRDRLVAGNPVYADLGRWLVGRFPAAARLACRAEGRTLFLLAEPRPGEALAVLHRVPGRKLPGGVRLLREAADFALVAGPASILAALRRPGIFNGGVVIIDLKRALRPGSAPVFASTDAPADPRIAQVVAKVNTTNLIAHIKALSAIHTRRANHPDNAKAVNYLLAEFKKIPGIKVWTEQFNTSYGPNVIAELPGLETPGEQVMTGAHLDSITGSGYSQPAPGADDNASGSASVLELARVLASAPWQRTIRFGLWNAEELGLHGSQAYASAARTRGDKIFGYLNLDMNAYRAPGDTVDVDFILNYSTSSLVSHLTQVSRTYVPTLGVKQGSFSYGTSDHKSFYQNGFPAIFYFEDIDRYSPYIHSSQDTFGQSANDMNLSTLITQSVAAGLADLAKPLDKPSFTLSVSTGPSLGGTAVKATGTSLASVAEVKVGGRSVPFTENKGSLEFSTPTAGSLGTVQVEIANPGGKGTAPFTYTATSPPALRVDSPLRPGGKGSAAVGGRPGDLAATLVSPLAGKTDLGLVVLDIGGGNPANLLLFAVGALCPGGGTLETPFQLPPDPALAGYTLHFQACLVDPATLTVAGTGPASLVIK